MSLFESDVLVACIEGVYLIVSIGKVPLIILSDDRF